MRARARTGPARVVAEVEGAAGGLYISGPLTPYEVESLYDQFAGRGADVRVVVDLGGTPRSAPEVRTLARRLKRLERSGVVVSMHTARARATSGR